MNNCQLLILWQCFFILLIVNSLPPSIVIVNHQLMLIHCFFFFGIKLKPSTNQSHSPNKNTSTHTHTQSNDTDNTEYWSLVIDVGNRLESEEDVCMSMSSFMIGVVMMLIILIISCLVTSLLCVKVRSAPTNQSLYPPSTFHAFSSSAYSKAWLFFFFLFLFLQI